MIQPLSNADAHELQLNPADTPSNSDESAFRNWQSRRDGARQQIRRLSRRELQVMQLVAHGHANKTIALELEISVKTIEKHRANAARKLGVGSTAEMVRLTVLADDEVEVRNRLARTENRPTLSSINDNQTFGLRTSLSHSFSRDSVVFAVVTGLDCHRLYTVRMVVRMFASHDSAKHSANRDVKRPPHAVSPHRAVCFAYRCGNAPFGKSGFSRCQTLSGFR